VAKLPVWNFVPLPTLLSPFLSPFLPLSCPEVTSPDPDRKSGERCELSQLVQMETHQQTVSAAF